ncbi:hypothetical protein SAMN05421493_11663 [Pseudobutyrivibrio sp. 49]|uniref:hypothetical protein n=1 Tax=unclassified Pseudobutyrivibrio TaxID=2638619 RepID=UPI00088C633D|nr:MULTISPECIES: hypothetical protein [unclassified Pseudobutyrivibrio]SDI50771.1 hypothetical protein SAMN05421493_11663 [Pseudobutyrivibrio sp. 49]SFO23659.1 hypothetical protein SAMN04487831_11362 [Pseudobutyrivibrio sp. UC1225]
MNRNIRAIAQIKKYSELINLLVIVFSIVLMLVIYFIVSQSDPMEPEDFREMLLFGVGGAYLGTNGFLKIFYIADEVPKGLSFGMTRKKLFIGLRVADFLELLVVVILALILVTEADANVILKVAAFLYGLFMWIEGLAGNNVIRYGKNVFWIYYIVFMVACIGLPRLTHVFPESATPFVMIFDFFTNSFFNQGVVWVALAAFILAGMIVNWITFRKLAVNYIV